MAPLQSVGCVSVSLKGLCEMQIMFTYLMQLMVTGGRQSQRGAVHSQARSDPLLTPHWSVPSPLGSLEVRGAMGL